MLPACVAHKSASEIAVLAAHLQVSEDPEANYLTAANLAYCGQTREALRLLKLAVRGNYCSWPAMLAVVRIKPEFAGGGAAGIVCQRNFLAGRQAGQQQGRR